MKQEIVDGQGKQRSSIGSSEKQIGTKNWNMNLRCQLKIEVIRECKREYLSKLFLRNSLGTCGPLLKPKIFTNIYLFEHS